MGLITMYTGTCSEVALFVFLNLSKVSLIQTMYLGTVHGRWGVGGGVLFAPMSPFFRSGEVP
jgi:hypothetical protein